jgi:hypothetical protein
MWTVVDKDKNLIKCRKGAVEKRRMLAVIGNCRHQTWKQGTASGKQDMRNTNVMHLLIHGRLVGIGERQVTKDSKGTG